MMDNLLSPTIWISSQHYVDGSGGGGRISSANAIGGGKISTELLKDESMWGYGISITGIEG